jgi:hypothetical protein
MVTVEGAVARSGYRSTNPNPNYNRKVVGGAEGLGQRWWEEERV